MPAGWGLAQMPARDEAGSSSLTGLYFGHYVFVLDPESSQPAATIVRVPNSWGRVGLEEQGWGMFLAQICE